MLKTTIYDGTGDGFEAKVAEVGKKQEPSLWVNINGISPGTTFPTTSGVTGLLINSTLSLNGLGVTTNMNVNGSVTNQVFSMPIDTTTNYDYIITEIVIYSYGGSIKLGNFFTIASLTNGCVLSLKADNQPITYNPIKITSEIDLLSSIGGFTMRAEAAGDNAKGIITFSPGLIFRTSNYFGTGNDDYLRFTIRDNLTAINTLYVVARGFKVATGTL